MALQLLPALTAGLGTAGVFGGIASMFGKKKKSQAAPNPLDSLRDELRALSTERRAQGEREKGLLSQEFAKRQTEGLQGIAENIRAERGFGNTSLQSRLNTELNTMLGAEKARGILNIDKYINEADTSDILNIAKMYPTQTEQPEEPSWMTNLLGVGANLAVQNWMDENKWKNIGKYLKPVDVAEGQTDWSFLDEPASWKSLTKLSP